MLTGPDFVKSLPMWKALDPDTLLAFEMNGEPLPVSTASQRASWPGLDRHLLDQGRHRPHRE